MAPKNAKALLYSQALDAAQTQARWGEQIAAPGIGNGLSWSELLRKYSKHNPDRQLEAATAEAEQVIQSAILSRGLETSDGDFQVAETSNTANGSAHNHTNGVQTLATSMQTISEDQKGKVQEAIVKLRQILNSSLQLENRPQSKLSALVVCALGEFTLGRYSESLHDLQNCPPNIPEPNGHLADLLVLSFSLEGLLFEQQQNTTDAVDAYSKAADAYAYQIGIRGTEQMPEMSKWAEIAQYRRALLSKASPTLNTLQHHKAYTFTHLPKRRLEVLRSHLSLLYKADNLDLVVVAAVQKEQESILRRITQFPRAGEVNSQMLNFIDRVYEGWELALQAGLQAESSKGLAETRRIIDIHNRALSYTFHSHRILRHLVHLNFADGNFDRAAKTFDLYSRLWLKAKETDLINVTREMRHFKALAKGHTSTNNSTDDDQEIDIDTTEEYISMCCVGARLYCKHLKREGSAQRAVELADRAIELLQELEQDNSSHENSQQNLRAKAERWRGISRVCLVYEVADPETRRENLKLSLEALTKSAAIEHSNFDTLFHLAFVQAIQRDVTSATDSIRRALTTEPARKDAYHLLVLLISADQKKHVAALQACDIVLGLRSGRPELADSNSADFFGPTSQKNAHGEEGSSATILPNSDIHPQQVEVATTPTIDAKSARRKSRRLSSNDMSNDLAFRREASSEGTSALPTAQDHIKAFAPSRREALGSRTSAEAAAVFEDDEDIVVPVAAVRTTAHDDLSFDALVCELELRITRNVLLEVVHGPKDALQDQKALFQAFAEDFAQYKVSNTEKPKASQGPVPSIKAPSLVTTIKARARHPSTSQQQQNGYLLQPTRSRTNSIRSAFSHRARDTPVQNGVSSDTQDSTPSQTHSQSQSNSPPASYASSILHNIAGNVETSIKSTPNTTVDSESANSSIETARHVQSVNLEQKLWLLSAATYRRAGDLEDARDAIEEAERLNDENADVWVQLGLLQMANNEKDKALQCMDKAFFFALDHIPAVVHMARILIEEGGQSIAIAEGYLDVLTQTNGWDVPEAWLLLAQVYELTNRESRSFECLSYALKLEESRPIRDVRLALPHVI